MPRGERHYCARMTEDDVREIHRLRGEGLSCEKIAARIERATESRVYDVIRGRAWKHITAPRRTDRRTA
jgi:IS30 family transposase